MQETSLPTKHCPDRFTVTNSFYFNLSPPRSQCTLLLFAHRKSLNSYVRTHLIFRALHGAGPGEGVQRNSAY